MSIAAVLISQLLSSSGLIGDKASREYLESHHIHELLENLAGIVFQHQPRSPTYCMEYALKQLIKLRKLGGSDLVRFDGVDFPETVISTVPQVQLYQPPADFFTSMTAGAVQGKSSDAPPVPLSVSERMADYYFMGDREAAEALLPFQRTQSSIYDSDYRNPSSAYQYRFQEAYDTAADDQTAEQSADEADAYDDIPGAQALPSQPALGDRDDTDFESGSTFVTQQSSQKQHSRVPQQDANKAEAAQAEIAVWAHLNIAKLEKALPVVELKEYTGKVYICLTDYTFALGHVMLPIDMTLRDARATICEMIPGEFLFVKHRDEAHITVRQALLSSTTKLFRYPGIVPFHPDAEPRPIKDGQSLYPVLLLKTKEPFVPGNELHDAAEAGDEPTIRRISQTHSVDVRDVLGNTALHAAARLGKDRVCALLTGELRCDVNAADATGRTALHLAAERNHTAVVDVLLHVDGIELNSRCSNGLSPLDCSLTNRCFATATMLVRSKRMILTKVAHKLISKFANSLEHLIILREPGEVRTKAVMTLLGLGDVCASPKEAAITTTALHCACGTRMLEIAMKMLTLDSTSINLRDNSGKTPLVVATQNRHSDVASALLEKGADANIVDNAGRTALHYAIQARDDQLTRFLLDRGAHAVIPDRNGDTPLHLACRLGELELIKLLLPACEGALDYPFSKTGQIVADPYAVPYPKVFDTVRAREEATAQKRRYARSDKTRYRNTPLLEAVLALKWVAMRVMVEAGANVVLPGVGGQTPLAVAVDNGEAEAVKLLLEYGADPNNTVPQLLHDTTPARKTLLRATARVPRLYELPAVLVAARRGHDAIVSQLIDRGGKVNPATVHFISDLMAMDGVRALSKMLVVSARTIPKDHPCWGELLAEAVLRNQLPIIQWLVHNDRLKQTLTESDNSFWPVYFAPIVFGRRDVLRVLMEQAKIDPAMFCLDRHPAHWAFDDRVSSSDLDTACLYLAERNVAFGSVLAGLTRHQCWKTVLFLLRTGRVPASVLTPAVTKSILLHGDVEIVKAAMQAGMDVRGSHKFAQAAAFSNKPDVLALVLARGGGFMTSDVKKPQPAYFLRSRVYMPYDGDIDDPLQRVSDQELCVALATASLIAGVRFDEPSAHKLLFHCCARGEEDLVLLMLNAGADINAPTDKDGILTPLFGAAMKGHANIVKILLERGVSKEQFGDVMTIAILNDFVDIAELILNQGASPLLPPTHIRDHSGPTNYHLQCTSFKSLFVWPQNSIHAVAVVGDPDLMGLLLSRCTAREAVASLQESGSVYAAARNDESPDAVSNSLTVLHRALAIISTDASKRARRQATACMLIDYMNEELLSRCDFAGRTALQLAAYGGYWSVVTRLLQKLSVEQTMSECTTSNGFYNVFVCACAAKQQEVLRLLLEGTIVNADLVCKLSRGYQPVAIGHAQLSNAVLAHFLPHDGVLSVSLFQWAALMGRVDVVRTLLSRGAKPSSTLTSIRESMRRAEAKTLVASLLFAVIQARQAEVAALLMDKGASLEQTGVATAAGRPTCWTARLAGLFAASTGCEAVVDVINRHKPWHPALAVTAARYGYTTLATRLLKEGATASPAVDAVTLLHSACWFGDEMLLAQVLSSGVDLNVRDVGGATPLSIAFALRRVPLIKKLVEAGADVDAALAFGAKSGSDNFLRGGFERMPLLTLSPPIVCAIENAAVAEELSWLIIDEDRSVELLRTLIRSGTVEVLRTYIDARRNARRSVMTHTHTLPLAAYAVSVGRQDMAEYLLEVDWEPLKSSSAPHPSMKTLGSLLHLAAAAGMDNVVARVIRGANVNARDERGCTALHYACAMGHVSTVTLLLQAGADGEAPCKWEVSPFQVVASPVSRCRMGIPDTTRQMLPLCTCTEYRRHDERATMLGPFGLYDDEIMCNRLTVNDLRQYAAAFASAQRRTQVSLSE
eukprot:TRINITY_DN3078_c0_g1_i1.p1 TRINITY_DN3078_c0_g1~~TRINITY_DN3078_c0_g1_i1.p1  ORF type:complete len:1931 (-),score=387.78 TRINITY_DN3078_c0_g1_i1:132-5924(-)